MATITSTQTGNWSDGSTWVGGVAPANGDTAVIGHSVTVNSNTVVGTSGVEGTAAVTLAAGGSLIVAEDIQLTIRGDLVQANYPLTLQAGATLEFDSSAASSPSTTSYQLLTGSSGTQTGATVTCSGTAGNRCTITSNPAGANGYINSTAYGHGNLNIVFTTFSKLGNPSHTTAYSVEPALGTTVNITDCIFDEFSGKIYAGSSENNTAHFTFERNEIINSTYSPILELNLTVKTTGTRVCSNNYIDRQLVFGNSSGMSGWTIDNNIIFGMAAGSKMGGDAVSFKNNTFIEEQGATSAYGFYNNTGEVKDFLLVYNNISGAHYDNTMSSYIMNYNGGVIENTFNVDVAPDFHAASLYTESPIEEYIKNTVYSLNAGGTASCYFAHLKGTKNTRLKFENNTAPVTFVAPQTGLYAGSGAMNFTGTISAFRNNLMWVPAGKLQAGNDYGLQSQRSPGVKTGTGLAGGSTTVLKVADWTFDENARNSLAGYRLKIGADIRTVASNTHNTVTVTVAFPATTVGAAYTLYGIDQITSATNNAWQGFNADGTLYGADNSVSTTTAVGYSGFTMTDPATVGVDDVILPALAFRDVTRSIATFATAGLGNPANSDWVTATSYSKGSGVSKAVAGFYGGATLNYRAKIAHTSSAATSPGGFTSGASIAISSLANTVNALVTTATSHGFSTGDVVQLRAGGVYKQWKISTVPTGTTFTINNSYLLGTGFDYVFKDWRDYWELESLYELRRAQLQQTGYNANATQDKAVAWIRAGYAPTGASAASLATAGYGGSYIGAVDVYIPPAGGGDSNRRAFGFGSSGFFGF